MKVISDQEIARLKAIDRVSPASDFAAFYLERRLAVFPPSNHPRALVVSGFGLDVMPANVYRFLNGLCMASGNFIESMWPIETPTNLGSAGDTYVVTLIHSIHALLASHASSP